MAQAAGIGTGTVQLAAGAGLTGLLAAGLMMSALAAFAAVGKGLGVFNLLAFAVP